MNTKSRVGLKFLIPVAYSDRYITKLLFVCYLYEKFVTQYTFPLPFKSIGQNFKHLRRFHICID